MMPRLLVRFVALGSLVLGPACGPKVILEEGSESAGESAGDSAGDSATSSSTTATTSSTTSAATSVTTTPPDPTTVSTTTPPDPTGDPEPGDCWRTCSVGQECFPPGYDPDDWACLDGFCEFVGEVPPCDDTTCPAWFGMVCASVDGLVQCVISCTRGGRECDSYGLECSGVSDEGLLHCGGTPCNGAAEGEPCEFQGYGQYGVCTDGVCVCTDDSQCTVEGFGCRQ